MRGIGVILVLGLGVFPGTGCRRAEAQDIRDEFEDDDYRNTYARAPGWEDGRLPSAGGPHGAFVDIYINDVMVEAIEAAEAEEPQPLEAWPEGSLIIKDGWSREEGGDYEYLAFMERREDGWFWAEWRRGSRLVVARESPRKCTGCHSSGEDEVRAFGLPQ